MKCRTIGTVGLVWVLAGLGLPGPKAEAQIVRPATPVTAGGMQFDPFSNAAANPYLNPLLAGSQTADRSTMLMYIMGARRYYQGQAEALQKDEAARRQPQSRGRAAAIHGDSGTGRYRFDSIGLPGRDGGTPGAYFDRQGQYPR
jgi:hypothetical protein